ncbi:hypothetical protein HQ403_01230 [Candidatus Kaiserbacteria bacterium]|nr:hypothetical protein [Candidatus Kaiserbacteria bacterium]
MEELETSLNFIVLQGLNGNEPVSLYPLQNLLLPFASELVALWWVVWMGVILFLFIKFIVLPLVRD